MHYNYIYKAYTAAEIKHSDSRVLSVELCGWSAGQYF